MAIQRYNTEYFVRIAGTPKIPDARLAVKQTRRQAQRVATVGSDIHKVVTQHNKNGWSSGKVVLRWVVQSDRTWKKTYDRRRAG